MKTAGIACAQPPSVRVMPIELPRAVNFITGPSRTGDIEQRIVLGAHGPRRLHILVVENRRDAEGWRRGRVGCSRAQRSRGVDRGDARRDSAARAARPAPPPLSASDPPPAADEAGRRGGPVGRGRPTAVRAVRRHRPGQCRAPEARAASDRRAPRSAWPDPGRGASGARSSLSRRRYRGGRRCVLVITGRGLGPDGPGVLKRAVPRWLAEAGLRRRILAVAAAQPRHGGAGALYLLLRRQR